MAYRDDISDLGAGNHWDFDGDALDQITTLNGTNSGGIFTDAAIAEDATFCYTTNSVSDRCVLGSSTLTNNSAMTRKAFGGWFMATAVNQPFTRIYGEGDATPTFQFVMGFGNTITFEVADPTIGVIQIYSDVSLVPNRAYHLFATFEGTGYTNVVNFYVDGVLQTNAQPADRAPDTTNIDVRTVNSEWGDPAGTVGLNATSLLMVAPVNGKFQHWASWAQRVLPIGDTGFLRMDARLSTDKVQTSDAPNPGATDDLEVKVWCKPDDITPTSAQTMASKHGASGQLCWRLVISNDGQLLCTTSNDGTAVVNTFSGSTIDADVRGFRVVWDQTADTIQFYTTDTIFGEDWSTLGTLKTGKTSTLHTTSTAATEIGSAANGNQQFVGEMYGAEISYASTVESSVDFRSLVAGATTYTDPEANDWSWTTNTPGSRSEVRDILFEKGALPAETISAGTESAMQTSLDAIDNATKDNNPLDIRISTVTGDGDLELTATNIVHDPLSSVHVQYMGTGTLTWINSGTSNASIGSTPNGGTIVFVNPATLDITQLIAGSEVRIYQPGTTNELAGVESSGTTFQTQVQLPLVTVAIISLDYEIINVDVDTTSDVELQAGQFFDRQYENL